MVFADTTKVVSRCLSQAGGFALLLFDAEGALRGAQGDEALFSLGREGLLALLATFGQAEDWQGAVTTHIGAQALRLSVSRADGAVVAFLQDLSDQITRETLLRIEATTDPLTGLLNRRGFERLTATAFRSHSGTETGHVIGVVDVDNLKRLNEGGGYQHGDRTLKGVARELDRSFRAGDITGRVGGDEFAFCLVNVPEPLVEKILKRLSARIAEETSATVTIGAVHCPAHSDPAQAQIRAGELALAAKRAGKNRVSIEVVR